MIRPSVAATHRKMLWSIIECSLQCFFPTTLCGVLAFDSVSRSSSSSSRLLLQPHTHLGQTPSFQHPLSHSIFHTQLCQPSSFTRNFVKHHLSNTIFHTPSFTFHLSHTTLSTIIFHTLSFTHNFVKHHLSHTIFHTPSLSTTIFPTLSFTHNFVKHHLSNTIFHTPSFTFTYSLSHTLFVNHHLSHTLFHTQLCRTPSFK